ncbi:hypothetical protein CQ13_36210 [Bradyrhizobium retamae]|uniref:Uncharacterized protein n=1 Tax=Bradyrhizobium retamae TaxID=1300035 RepID=A0A0R3MBE9_9BRAD|nr:hypothetical protein CQ13_36210 [Bradyrhizobium retamae]
MRPKLHSMPPLSRITPLMLADALVEHRLLPGDELEAEAVVDHGKAPAGERGDARKLAGDELTRLARCVLTRSSEEPPLAFIKSGIGSNVRREQCSSASSSAS